jgi:hypothetical protein
MGAAWSWDVTYRVASSGYIVRCHVTARRKDPGGDFEGSAYCDVSQYDVLNDVIEELAVESMLAAVEPNLLGEPNVRRIVLTSFD